MKSALLYGKHDVRIASVPEPSPRSRQVVVKVAFAGLCGTDLHQWQGHFNPRQPLPTNIGHEFSGVVSAVGDEVTTCRVGDRVAVDSFVACGKCHYCRSGAVLHCTDRTMSSDAWAEYVVVHEGAVYQIPDSMSLETAALAEPLAAGLQAIDEAQMRSGCVALLLGAGPIGLGILSLARVSGAAVTIVSEPSEYRRELARRLGADVVVDPREQDLGQIVRSVSNGLGADVAFDAVTRAATVQQGIDAVRLGGLVLVVGNAPPDDELPTRPAELHRSGKMIKGTTKRAFNFDRTLRWLAKLDFMPLITHKLPLEDVNHALELSRDGRAGKILLIPAEA